jgi:hypothetical protein
MGSEDDTPVDPQHTHMPTRLYRKTGGIVHDTEDEEEAPERPDDTIQTSEDDFDPELSCETQSDKVCS